MDIVLRLGPRADGVVTPQSGLFVVHYDPRIEDDGAFRLDLSDDIKEARGFSTVGEAADYIRQPCPNVPYDGPGHLNRPLTAYHIQLVPRV